MTAPGALDGITVLDLSSVVLGPMAAQYLGDMGADVIKIEPPEGDVTRGIGARRSPGMGALFLSNNRNKRSVVLDLKNPIAQAALRKMAENCDVLLHSIRAPAAAKLGLDYPSLAAANPGLVYCHAKGFSDHGPYGGKPAYDDVVQALSGLAMLQTIVGGEPRYVPSIIADKITAVHAAYAIVLALFHRFKTQRGQLVGVPMLETMVAFNAAEHLGAYVFEPPIGPMGYTPVRQAMRRPFPTQDGFLCFMPYNDAHWRRFLEIVDRPDLAADPGYTTMAGRQADIGRVWATVGDIVAIRTNAGWLAALGATDIPFAVLNDLEDLITDPHLSAIGFWQMHPHPTEGMLRLPANPLEMSATPPSVRRLPPVLGAHTQEVLVGFGVGQEIIDCLINTER